MAQELEPSKRNKSDPKDKVLHTRIPEQLEMHLKDHAENLGLSVSSIVRNVLLNTFNLVEGVVSDSARIALGPKTESRQPAPEQKTAPKAIYGWQPLILNLNAVCHECNDLLPKGSAGGLGQPVSEPPIFVCQRCLEQLQKNAAIQL